MPAEEEFLRLFSGLPKGRFHLTAVMLHGLGPFNLREKNGSVNKDHLAGKRKGEIDLIPCVFKYISVRYSHPYREEGGPGLLNNPNDTRFAHPAGSLGAVYSQNNRVPLLDGPDQGDEPPHRPPRRRSPRYPVSQGLSGPCHPLPIPGPAYQERRPEMPEPGNQGQLISMPDGHCTGALARLLHPHQGHSNKPHPYLERGRGPNRPLSVNPFFKRACAHAVPAISTSGPGQGRNPLFLAILRPPHAERPSCRSGSDHIPGGHRLIHEKRTRLKNPKRAGCPFQKIDLSGSTGQIAPIGWE